MRKGLLIVISGPSGTGKGTVCEVVRKKNPDIAYYQPPPELPAQGSRMV